MHLSAAGIVDTRRPTRWFRKSWRASFWVVNGATGRAPWARRRLSLPGWCAHRHPTGRSSHPGSAKPWRRDRRDAGLVIARAPNGLRGAKRVSQGKNVRRQLIRPDCDGRLARQRPTVIENCGAQPESREWRLPNKWGPKGEDQAGRTSRVSLSSRGVPRLFR